MHVKVCNLSCIHEEHHAKIHLKKLAIFGHKSFAKLYLSDLLMYSGLRKKVSISKVGNHLSFNRREKLLLTKVYLASPGRLQKI